MCAYVPISIYAYVCVYVASNWTEKEADISVAGI